MKLIIILALSIAAVEVDSCSCLDVSTQEKYRSDFVSHLKITSKNDPNPKGLTRRLQVTYDVEHIYVYKNASDTDELPKRIVTAGHESTCGVSFSTGMEYLVGGSVGSGNIYADLCGLSRSWTWVSQRDKALLSNYNCSTA